jgi:hypothetical protein
VHIFTYLKDTSYRTFPCADYIGAAAAADDAGYACAPGEAFWTSGTLPTCKCWRTRNQFFLGVEEMQLFITHEYDAPRKVPRGARRGVGD